MNPGDQKTLEIAKRTRKNLTYIYNQKELGADVEEFTQLINSMLGILICLREDYIKGKNIEWSELTNYDLQPIIINDDPPNKISPNLEQAKSFNKTISNLRHGFAHNCFALIGDPISKIQVWNIPPSEEDKKINRVWQITLSEKQLMEITNLLLDYIELKYS